MRTIYTIRRKLYNDALGLGQATSAIGGVVNNTVNAVGSTAKNITGTGMQAVGGLAKGIGDAGIGKTVGTIGGAGLGIAGGMAGGAKIGAALGSFAGGPVGTILGGATGALLGGTIAAPLIGGTLGRAAGKAVDKGLSGLGNSMQNAGENMQMK